MTITASSIKKIVAGIVFNFLLLAASPAVGNNPANISAVPTIAALQALGAASAQYPNIIVQEYAAGYGSNGGGIFQFKTGNFSTQCTNDPRHGLYVPASNNTSCSTGAWVRKLNNGAMLIDYFGASTTLSDSTAAVQAAFNACSYFGVPLLASSGTYNVAPTLTLPYTCSFHGVGTNFTTGNYTRFLANADGVGSAALITINGGGGLGTYPYSQSYGGFAVDGTGHTVRRGLYATQISHAIFDDIYAKGTTGAGFLFGNMIVTSASHIGTTNTNTGNLDAAQIQIDGERTSGNGTTFYGDDLDAETTSNTSGCGISVDAYIGVHIVNSVAENTGQPICLGELRNAPVQAVSIDTFDMEGLSASQSCIEAVALDFIDLLTLQNITCFGPNSSGADFLHIGQVYGLSAFSNSFINQNSANVFFDFTVAPNVSGGTTFSDTWLSGNEYSMTLPVYVKIAGTTAPDANIGRFWSYGAYTTATITAGFGTSPTVAGGATQSTFIVTVGTGGIATTGTLTFSRTAANGWQCSAADITNNVATTQTGGSTTTCAFTGASAWTAGDKILVTARQM